MSVTNVSRDVELEEDTETFIGPPPPALVTEVESTNEAERFEEVLPSFSSLHSRSICCLFLCIFVLNNHTCVIFLSTFNLT